MTSSAVKINRYIVRRTAYGYVAYDLDIKANVGREVKSKASVQERVEKLNQTAA